jgi:hypothetical protein
MFVVASTSLSSRDAHRFLACSTARVLEAHIQSCCIAVHFAVARMLRRMGTVTATKAVPLGWTSYSKPDL